MRKERRDLLREIQIGHIQLWIPITEEMFDARIFTLDLKRSTAFQLDVVRAADQVKLLRAHQVDILVLQCFFTRGSLADYLASRQPEVRATEIKRFQKSGLYFDEHQILSLIEEQTA